jgi:gluconate kinase
VFLDADPLEDIRNTQKVTAVIVNGRCLPKADLQKILQRAEESLKKEPPAPQANGVIVTACELSSTYRGVIRKGKTEESLRFCC